MKDLDKNFVVTAIVAVAGLCAGVALVYLHQTVAGVAVISAIVGGFFVHATGRSTLSGAVGASGVSLSEGANSHVES